MDYAELSIKELKDKCNKLSALISNSYHPDIIVYIAKGGFLIGEYIGKELEVPVIPIYAERSGNSLKNKIAPLLSLLPQWLKLKLRLLELKSGLHNKHKKRHAYFRISDLETIDTSRIHNILLVDDSVDTGNSMLSASEVIKNVFAVRDIRLGALNIWNESMAIVNVEFYLYKNTILITPMSKDSKEYNVFMDMYENRNFV